MTGKSAPAKGKFLEGLASVLRGSTASASTDTNPGSDFKSAASQLQSALVDLQSSIKRQKDKLAAGSTSSPSNASAKSNISNKEIEQQELEQAVGIMRSDILKMHNKLKTGFTDQRLNELGSFAAELTDLTSGQDMDARIRAAIVDRVNRELGPLSWGLLMHFMERVSVSWPEPSGALPGQTPEQKANVIQHHMNEAKGLFLSQNFQKSSENMAGLVSAWRRYPEAETWLWQEVALRGVAATIRLHLLQGAIEKLRSEGDAIRSKAHELIQETMSKVQAMLLSGVKSLGEAEEIVRSTDTVVRDVLPELAWQRCKVCVDENVSKLAGK